MNPFIFKRLLNISIVLALGVVMLGAYTRLTDAGLGCPDWPGCYGHLVLPSKAKELVDAQKSYPHLPIEETKAWTEMAHRYIAGTLVSLIVFIIGALRFKRSFKSKVPGIIPFLLLLLVGGQAALGMYTVTMKLFPPVVMGHLLGGISILALLVSIRCHFFAFKPLLSSSWNKYLAIGIFLLFCQIALGGWVSSNYAGISCTGFPTCNGEWIPTLNFKEAFNMFQLKDINFQGGHLDVAARITIQWIHRIGAVCVWLYWTILSICIWRKFAMASIRLKLLMFNILLWLQIVLGILNVVYLLPLHAAVLHNGIAALLFATSIGLYYSIFGGRLYEIE
jgi:heme a synthase